MPTGIQQLARYQCPKNERGVRPTKVQARNMQAVLLLLEVGRQAKPRDARGAALRRSNPPSGLNAGLALAGFRHSPSEVNSVGSVGGGLCSNLRRDYLLGPTHAGS